MAAMTGLDLLLCVGLALGVAATARWFWRLYWLMALMERKPVGQEQVRQAITDSQRALALCSDSLPFTHGRTLKK